MRLATPVWVESLPWDRIWSGCAKTQMVATATDPRIILRICQPAKRLRGGQNRSMAVNHLYSKCVGCCGSADQQIASMSSVHLFVRKRRPP
jgi:hypothetical protein